MCSSGEVAALRLPSNPSNGSLGPSPDTQLPHFVHDQDSQCQWQRDQPILNRHRRRAKDALDTRFHGYEYSYDKRHDDTAEKVWVLAGTVEGVCLDDGHALVTDGEEVAPL
jgi:hypothetical protein